jgi:hypothetical protein
VSLLRPFFREDVPQLPPGEQISKDDKSEEILLWGTVRSAAGEALPNAKLMVWQTSSSGHYDLQWRNRAEFPVGREQVRAFLQRKWARELDYRLIKELWACARCINDLPIAERDRKFCWPLGRRPDDHSGCSKLGL